MPRVRNICKECGNYKPYTSSPKCIPCRFKFLIAENGCWIWAGYCDPGGYGEFSLYGKENSAYRVSWLIHNGPIPNGLHVLHTCDNPPCVNPDHLFLGTHQDNMRDKAHKGRTLSNGLTAADISSIRTSSEPSKVLAARHRVHVTHINRIKRGARWGNLTTNGALAGSSRAEPIAKVRRAL